MDVIDAGAAAILGGVVGGTAGILGQVAASYLARSREREARNQERLERAYVEVMAAVNHTALTVSRTEPDFWFGPEAPKPPEPITDEDVLRLESLIGLFGSDEVLGELLVYQDHQRIFRANLFLYKNLQAGFPSPGVTGQQLNSAMDAFRASRTELLGHAKHIESVARGELHGQRRPITRWPHWIRTGFRLRQ